MSVRGQRVSMVAERAVPSSVGKGTSELLSGALQATEVVVDTDIKSSARFAANRDVMLSEIESVPPSHAPTGASQPNTWKEGSSISVRCAPVVMGRSRLWRRSKLRWMTCRSVWCCAT